MGFKEFKLGESEDKPPNIPKGILAFIELPLMILFNLFPPLSRWFAGEYRTYHECDGWIAEWRTGRFLCGYCGARITRFEFEGQPYPIPDLWLNVKSGQYLETPVGVFSVWKGRWTRGHWELTRYIPHGEFDERDRRRVWYLTEPRDRNGAALEQKNPHFHGFTGPVLRKAGTPAEWCLLARAEPLWFDPRRLPEVLDAWGAEEDSTSNIGRPTRRPEV